MSESEIVVGYLLFFPCDWMGIKDVTSADLTWRSNRCADYYLTIIPEVSGESPSVQIVAHRLY